ERINLMLSAETDKFKYEPRYNVFISLKGRPIFDETGKPFSKEEIGQETKDLEKTMKILKEQFDKYNKRAIYSYYIQRLCLVSGLILGALFKIINSF
ncbi:MAG TPA: hypothetical protein VJ000_00685, partial [Thermodesulfovibrionia bacterium]|nr:hypothetical protein [Thermodesulfovibrionia bacterium]